MMRRVLLATAMEAITAGCDIGPEAVGVDSAWVRLAAVPDRPAAAYFTIHGGPAATELISVSADTAIRTEMHESMKNGMRAIARVPVPARTEVAFTPGGRHAMLFNMNRGIVPGRTVLLTLTFADGTRLERKATVHAAGDDAPR